MAGISLPRELAAPLTRPWPFGSLSLPKGLGLQDTIGEPDAAGRGRLCIAPKARRASAADAPSAWPPTG